MTIAMMRLSRATVATVGGVCRLEVHSAEQARFVCCSAGFHSSQTMPPVRPGISLFVLPTPPQVRGDYAVPELHTGIRSDGIMLLPERERFRITADKLEAIRPDRDETLPARPSPIAAIVEQNAKQEGDEGLCNEGFTMRLTVLPPKQ